MLKRCIWLHIMPSVCVSVCVSGTYGCTLLLAFFAAWLLVFCGEAILNVKAQYKVKARGGVLLAKCKSCKQAAALVKCEAAFSSKCRDVLTILPRLDAIFEPCHRYIR